MWLAALVGSDSLSIGTHSLDRSWAVLGHSRPRHSILLLRYRGYSYRYDISLTRRTTYLLTPLLRPQYQPLLTSEYADYHLQNHLRKRKLTLLYCINRMLLGLRRLPHPLQFYRFFRQESQ